MLSPSQEHRYCHRRDASLKLEDKAAHAATAVLLTHYSSMVSPVRNTAILQCFEATGSVTDRA